VAVNLDEEKKKRGGRKKRGEKKRRRVGVEPRLHSTIKEKRRGREEKGKGEAITRKSYYLFRP